MIDHIWLTHDRNMAIICAMMLVYCAIYLVAAEYVSTEQSKGEILVFHRRKKIGCSKAQECENVPNSIFPEDVLRMGSDDHADTPLPTHTAHEKSPPVLYWKHINYDIKTGRNHRRILHDLNGWVKPATLTVLMVSS